MTHQTLIEKVFQLPDRQDFESLCLEVFNHQFLHIELYRQYCELLKKTPENVSSLADIPFLPISAFKNHKILAKNVAPDLEFKSSGTGNQTIRSTHYVQDKQLYNTSLLSTFQRFFGDPGQYEVFSLLPGYSENPNSSLIYMVEEIAKSSSLGKVQNFSGDFEGLIQALNKSNEAGRKTFLFGVSFALMDLASKFDLTLKHTTILETGGMKGRRKEITREELHQFIAQKLQAERIVSEYGMTELLSQAYAVNDGLFECPAWMKVLIRDVQDPLCLLSKGSGAINVVDLANIHSCAFIATDDLGKLYEDGSFEVLGRFDHSDIRGCNLLYEGSN